PLPRRTARSGRTGIVGCDSRRPRTGAARFRVAMTETANPVDPPDYATWPTARRLLRLWREQWRLAVLALACAFAYSSISIVIPVLVARTIDHSIVRHD